MHGRRLCTLCGRVGLWILSFFGVENTWLATNSISLTPSIESERHSFDRQKRRCVPNKRARLLLADDWLILDFFSCIICVNFPIYFILNNKLKFYWVFFCSFFSKFKFFRSIFQKKYFFKSKLFPIFQSVFFQRNFRIISY